MPVWVVVFLGSNWVQILETVENNHAPLVQWWFTAKFPTEVLWHRVPNWLENVLVWQVARSKVVWVYAVMNELFLHTLRLTMYCFYRACLSICPLFCRTFLLARVEYTWKLPHRDAVHLGQLAFSSRNNISRSACRPTTPVSVDCINLSWSRFLSVPSFSLYH